MNWHVRARKSRQRPVAQTTRRCKRPLELPQVQHIDMNSQRVPKTVEVSKQHHTDMNVDVQAHRTVQRKHNRFPSHERAEGDTVKQQ